MSIKIKRDERQVFTGGSFVMTSTVLIKVEDNRIYNVTDEQIVLVRILAAIGSPASSPKPRGKSPSWKTGQQRQRKTRYPIVKKRTSKHRKQTAESA